MRDNCFSFARSKWNRLWQVPCTFKSVHLIKISRISSFTNSINHPCGPSSQQSIDGWRLLCPSGQHTYEFFIDPQQTIGHEYLIFGLRELTLSERAIYCSNRSLTKPPVIKEQSEFTADYQIRVFISGCYYLDKHNYWRVRGLHIGPKTNEQHTQCYSSHLTPFAGGFRVVPKWIQFNYVFSNADFHKNKTIYLTVIIVCILYLLLMIYARLQDRKDIEQVTMIDPWRS